MRAIVLGLFLLGLGAGPSAAVELASHRAAYRLSLVSDGNEAGVTAVRGGLVIEWRAECDGWISNQRLGFAVATEEGPGYSRDTRASSWESRDNKSLRFNVRSYDDGKLGDESQGEARLDAADGSGEASFTLPEPGRLELPAGTVFPTEHVRRLILAAQAGEHVLTLPVFDGSAGDSLTEVSAVIGAARTAPDGTPRWPAHLAYFGVGQSDSTPDFEIAFDLDAGGILYDLTLTFVGEFTMKATMEKLERLPSPDCH